MLASFWILSKDKQVVYCPFVLLSADSSVLLNQYLYTVSSVDTVRDYNPFAFDTTLASGVERGQLLGDWTIVGGAYSAKKYKCLLMSCSGGSLMLMNLLMWHHRSHNNQRAFWAWLNKSCLWGSFKLWRKNYNIVIIFFVFIFILFSTWFTLQYIFGIWFGVHSFPTYSITNVFFPLKQLHFLKTMWYCTVLLLFCILK